jgi:hypothetical protein
LVVYEKAHEKEDARCSKTSGAVAALKHVQRTANLDFVRT